MRAPHPTLTSIASCWASPILNVCSTARTRRRSWRARWTAARLGNNTSSRRRASWGCKDLIDPIDLSPTHPRPPPPPSPCPSAISALHWVEESSQARRVYGAMKPALRHDPDPQDLRGHTETVPPPRPCQLWHTPPWRVMLCSVAATRSLTHPNPIPTPIPAIPSQPPVPTHPHLALSQDGPSLARLFLCCWDACWLGGHNQSGWPATRSPGIHSDAVHLVHPRGPRHGRAGGCTWLGLYPARPAAADMLTAMWCFPRLILLILSVLRGMPFWATGRCSLPPFVPSRPPTRVRACH